MPVMLYKDGRQFLLADVLFLVVIVFANDPVVPEFGVMVASVLTHLLGRFRYLLLVPANDRLAMQN